MKAYRIGNSIVLPHVRFVSHGNRNGRRISMMFHSVVVKTNGRYKTLGCDKMDGSGFCLGHEISEKEFLEKYCGATGTGAKSGKK